MSAAAGRRPGAGAPGRGAALAIETFSNSAGGNALYKALAHPVTADRVPGFLESLAARGPVAVYDPRGQLDGFAALYGLSGLAVAAYLVQRIEDLGRRRLGCETVPITSLPRIDAPVLLIAAFDAARLRDHIAHLIPGSMQVRTFDELRLPDALISHPGAYLNPLNFATNFAFFRDAGGQHTRLVSANYWFGHGAAKLALWLRLYGAGGEVLAEWSEEQPAAANGIVIDSREVRARFALPEFTGTLFVHAVGAAGHDIVKYALDTYGDAPSVLSATHDANAWPADYYAGLPAPRPDERVILWVQNSHGLPIPRGGIGVNRMGSEQVAWLDEEIPGFGTHALDVGTLLPGVHWPQQIEVRAGRRFVRPRYEVQSANGRSRIAHVNVERADLDADPGLPGLGERMGKGYILPAPILPPDRWDSIALPTPMARGQAELPLAAVLYDAGGAERARLRLGRVRRDACPEIDLNAALEAANARLDGGYGHVELMYDFSGGGSADGWLHALFRYRDRHSGHAAETSFGAHIYNVPMTYRGEPQSYAGAPPGLSTRLFLRLGPQPLRAMFHLIYPASLPWRPESSTDLILYDGGGAELARRRLSIPCGGSRLGEVAEFFDADRLAAAGRAGYLIVRDATCRLFGYEALLGAGGAFSLDHLFGF